MPFSNCFLCDYRLSEKAITCPKCGDPDPHHVGFLIEKIRTVLNQCACPKYSDGIMECYGDSEQIDIFHKVCDTFLTQTLQEISDLKPRKFFPPYMVRRDYKRLKRIIFEHNSIIFALSDYLFSPLPDIENLVEMSKLDYLLTPSLKRPFHLKGVAKSADIKQHTLLHEAVYEL
jgi:hypothetical protein